MQRRPYGTTGEHLSVIGFGGIVVSQVEVVEAARLVGRAVERGVNYFDVAPSYGNAEERLGPALEPYRNDVYSWPARLPSARGPGPPPSCANPSKPCAPTTSTCTNCTP